MRLTVVMSCMRIEIFPLPKNVHDKRSFLFSELFLRTIYSIKQITKGLNARSNHVAHNVRLPDAVAAWRTSFLHFGENEDRKIKVTSHRKLAIAFDSCCGPLDKSGSVYFPRTFIIRKSFYFFNCVFLIIPMSRFFWC